MCLIRSLQRFWIQQLSIMQEFGASLFHLVVCWHKLGEVESECILCNFIVLTIVVPKINKVGENLSQFWWKTILTVFYWDTVYYVSTGLRSLLVWDARSDDWPFCLQELTRQLQKRVEVGSSNGHQVSPSASATLVNVEGATNDAPLETNDSDVC